MKKIYLILAFSLIYQMAKAQDVHFSQYEYAPLNINPAHTGLFSGDFRLAGNYRSQWFSVPVSYRTTSITFDAHLLPFQLENDVWGVGLTFNHDQAGDAKLSLLNLFLSTAYTKSIGKRFFISGGVQLGFANRRFQLNKLTFNDQFNGDVYDPNIHSYDYTKLAGKTNFSFFDINAGLNFRYKKDARTWFDIGGGLFHLTKPNQSFLGDDIALPMRINVMANGSIQLSPVFDILPAFWFQMQGTYQEMVFGTDVRYHLNTNPGRETAFKLGVFHRLDDAIIARLGFEYQRFHFGLSYDVNISGFVPASRYNGGYELSMIYIWSKVPSLPIVKACPIF